MDSNTKKKAVAIGVPVVILIAFISAAAAFGNNNPAATASTTTTKQGQTAIVYGNANAVVANYSDYGNVTVNGSNPKGVAAMNATLSRLESNGSIYTYIYSDGVYDVELGSMTLFGLKGALSGSGNATVSGVEYVYLPGNLTMYYGSQPILVRVPDRQYAVPTNDLQQIGGSFAVKVAAQVSADGTVYDNQISLQRK